MQKQTLNKSKQDKKLGSKSHYSVVELFAGAGGLALGLEKAGLSAAMLVEIDKHCVATLKANRPKWNVVADDIANVDFKGIHADIVTGGFPCQAFSYAGKRLGFEDIRGTLFFEFARCVKEVNPKMFLGENVEGLLKHDGGRTFKTMVDILAGFGYKIQYKVLNAAEYGVPQKRKRLVIVGTKGDLEFHFPEPHKKIVTLRDALKNVPHSPGQRYTKEREEILKLVPPGGSWVNLPVKLQKKYLGKSFYSGGGKRGMARRISWDEPCLTLTCSPSQKQTDRIHPEETRPFTVREYARIQTFPDNWKFMGGVGAQYRQIGNAVAVKFAETIGISLIECLEGVASRNRAQKTLKVYA